MRMHRSANGLQILSCLLGLVFLYFACSASNEEPDTNANPAAEVKAKLVYFSIPG